MTIINVVNVESVIEPANPRKRNYDLIVDGESGGSIASAHSSIEVTFHTYYIRLNRIY